MQRVRVVHWLRFSAGMGLLLLLVAAQEKLCLGGAAPVAAPEPAPRSEDGRTAPKPRKAPLPQIVPDVATHRFAVPGAAAELRLERGNRDGAVSRGPDRAGRPGSECLVDGSVPFWRCFAPSIPVIVSPGPQPDPPGAVPLLTAICPHGPPASLHFPSGRRGA